MNFFSIMERFGIPIAVLCVFSWFVGKYLWPFLVKQVDKAWEQVETAQATLSQTQNEFMVSLKHRDEIFARHAENTARTLDRIVEKLDERRKR